MDFINNLKSLNFKYILTSIMSMYSAYNLNSTYIKNLTYYPFSIVLTLMNQNYSIAIFIVFPTYSIYSLVGEQKSNANIITSTTTIKLNALLL